MSDTANLIEGYGISLSANDIKKIKKYLKNDAEYKRIEEAWWCYLLEYKYESLPFIIHSEIDNYQYFNSVLDSGCYIGIPLWKPASELLLAATKGKINIPSKEQRNLATVFSFLEECGINTAKKNNVFFIFAVAQ